MNGTTKKIFLLLAIEFLFLTVFNLCGYASCPESETIEIAVVTYAAPVLLAEPAVPELISEIEDVPPLLSEEDVSLIALVTMAEAEGECEEGQRLVIDTILNRVDSEYFPDTVYDVVYQPHQFSSMWNGRADRCEVQEDICQLVEEELEERLNSDVIFFNAGNYSKYGVPMFQVEHHYFSSYD